MIFPQRTGGKADRKPLRRNEGKYPMLMICGVLTIVAGALCTVAGSLVFRNRALSAMVRRLVGGPVFGVFAATLMGLGLVMLFAFLVGDKSQSPTLVQFVVALAIAAAGAFGVHLIGRLAKALPDDQAMGPRMTAESPRRAA